MDTLAQELALLQDKGKRRIAILGSRHVPVVSIHLVELLARSLVQEGHLPDYFWSPRSKRSSNSQRASRRSLKTYGAAASSLKRQVPESVAS